MLAIAAHRRRDGAAALHRVQQPLPERGHRPAHRLAPGADPHLRHLALRRLARPGVDGGAGPGGARLPAQPHGARGRGAPLHRARRARPRRAERRRRRPPSRLPTHERPHAASHRRGRPRGQPGRPRRGRGARLRGPRPQALGAGALGVLRRLQGRQGHQHERPGPPDHGHHRALRLRQIHLPPLPQPHARAHAGRPRGRPRRARRHRRLRPRRRPGAAPAPRGHGVPEAQPVPDHVPSATTSSLDTASTASASRMPASWSSATSAR